MLDILYVVLVIFLVWVYVGIMLVVFDKSTLEDKLTTTPKQSIYFIFMFLGLYLMLMLIDFMVYSYNKIVKLFKRIYQK